MFIVEGNIGAGKSTFLKLLAAACTDIDIMLEPLAQWHSEHSSASLLDHFVTDPQRWACTMETFAMLCRSREHVALSQIQTTRPKVCERSVYSGHYCFARNGYLQGFMTPLEWSVYEQFYEHLVVRACVPPQGFIYLRTDPDVAYERIQKRNRSGEEGISRAYVHCIHERHEEFLLHSTDVEERLKAVPVLVLDGNPSCYDSPDHIHEMIERVRTFIAAHTICVPTSRASVGVHERT